MRHQTLGTVAVWLAGGAALAGDPPASGDQDLTAPPPAAATALPPADFPPPALPPLPKTPVAPPQASPGDTLPKTPEAAPQPLPLIRSLPNVPEAAPLPLPLIRSLPNVPEAAPLPLVPTDPLPLLPGQPSEMARELIPNAKDTPYFGIARLTSMESRPTGPTQPWPLLLLPGIAGTAPNLPPRDLRSLPETHAVTPNTTPYFGMAVPGPAPAMTSAPVVLRDPYVSPADEGFGQNFFGSIDYLLFWMRRSPTPPLVQTVAPDVATSTLADPSGNLPAGATVTLFGSDGIDQGAFSGVRAQFGLWLNSCSTIGVDASYLHLFEQSTGFSIRSNGVPVIGRGYFDVTEGREAFLFYSTPDGTQHGFIDIQAPTELYTFDTNLRVKGCTVFSDRLDLIGGFRYLNLRESLSINSGADIFDPAGALVETITSSESFRTKNQFYGSQVGLESHYRYGCLTLDFSTKFAMGWVRQEAEITGGSQVAIPGQPTQSLPNRSILYVQPTNAGSYSRNEFAVLPEFLVKLGYQVTPHVRATFGYDLLYLSNVIRPGSALDAGVNPSNTEFIAVRQPNTALRPAFNFNGTDFWAQGMTFGFVVTY